MASAEEAFFKNLEEQLQDLTDDNASFKGLLYGGMGVGKTVLAFQVAQFITPTEKNILYIDSAEGWTSLQNHRPLRNRTKRWTDTRLSILEKLVQGINSGIGWFGSVGTVIIDEHSSIADSDLRAVTKVKAMKEKDKDPDTPTWPDMNTSQNRLIKITGDLVRMHNVHLICIAHDRQDLDHLKRPVTGPSYKPQLGKELSRLFHLVGRVEADEIDTEEGRSYKRTVQVHPKTLSVAKTRVGGFKTPYTTAKELIVAIQEWLGGERETEEVQVVQPTNVTPEVEITTDDLVESILEG